MTRLSLSRLLHFKSKPIMLEAKEVPMSSLDLLEEQQMTRVIKVKEVAEEVEEEAEAAAVVVVVLPMMRRETLSVIKEAMPRKRSRG